MVVCTPRKTPLEKTKFSYTNACQLEIASSLMMGIAIHLPLSALGPNVALTCAAPVHADIVSVSSDVLHLYFV